jgi:hypothetical protein
MCYNKGMNNQDKATGYMKQASTHLRRVQALIEHIKDAQKDISDINDCTFAAKVLIKPENNVGIVVDAELSLNAVMSARAAYDAFREIPILLSHLEQIEEHLLKYGETHEST